MDNLRASGLCKLVFSGSFAVGGNGLAANDFSITDKLAKFRFFGPIVLQWVVTRTAGASTTDLTITASLDGGTNYTTLIAFTQISAGSGSEIKSITIPAGAKIKTDINLGTGTTSTIALYVAGCVAAGSGK